MESRLEYRNLAVAPALDSLQGQETIRTIRGIAVPYERWTTLATRAKIQEKIIKGAFDQSIRLVKEGRKIVQMQINHDPKRVVTDTSPNTAGNLRLESRNDGLYYIADLPNTALGRWLAAEALAARFRGVSIGFKKKGFNNNVTVRERVMHEKISASPAPTQDPDGDIDGTDYVTGFNPQTGDEWSVLKNVDLQEISLLTEDHSPAYAGTTIETRSKDLIQFIGIIDAVI